MPGRKGNAAAGITGSDGVIGEVCNEVYPEEELDVSLYYFCRGHVDHHASIYVSRTEGQHHVQPKNGIHCNGNPLGQVTQSL